MKVKHLLDLYKFQEVYRACNKKNNIPENDAEHSWFVAMLILCLMPDLEDEFGELNKEKLLTMAIIHDMGELGTGDIPTWAKNNNHKLDEISFIRNYFDKLNRADLIPLFEELENTSSLEANIVKSCDRIAPVMLRIFTEEGWKNVEQDHSTQKALDERQIPRHKFSKTMMSLYQELTNIAIQKDLFND